MTMSPIDDLPTADAQAPARSSLLYLGLLALLVVGALLAVIATRRTSAADIVTKPAVAGAQPAAPANATASVGSTAAGQPTTTTPAVTLPVLRSSAPAVEPTGWINTPGLAPADLNGKVVLYEFWTFGCYNCKNVLPHVKAWNARYEKDGLIVLSIHTPEFDYEGKVDNIQKFVTENGITYPVALDPNSKIWTAFSNHYWPNMYLHDQQGQRRYEHIGEGAYDETEDAIRSLLGVDPGSPRAEKV